MAAPETPASPPVVFNDNAIPHGSRYELFCFGGTTSPSYRGWYLLEHMKPSLPGKIVERPNAVGGPNGFSIVAAQEKMSAKAQLPSQSSPTIKIGDWFQDSTDPANGTVVVGLPNTGGTVDTWVVETATQSLEMNGYWYQDLSLVMAHNPPA